MRALLCCYGSSWDLTSNFIWDSCPQLVLLSFAGLGYYWFMIYHGRVVGKLDFFHTS